MFIPHTDVERQEMLKTIGKQNLADLFKVIPEEFRFPELDLPPALSEMEAQQQFSNLAQANNACDEMACFLGAGAYNHYVPAAVDFLLHRGDFFTAYTPYQPEISQGTLQAIFEFQSLIANLTGMEIANASHYDGATAAAEACISAYHHFRAKRPKLVLSPALNPQYLETIRTYFGMLEGSQLVQPEDIGVYADPDHLAELVDDQTALVLVQYPDFFGDLNDLAELTRKAHEQGALVAVSVNPLALGLLKPPAEFGVDFVIGEGQPLGIPMSYGGPYLGFFATRKELVRKISGRIVGETVDAKGQRGYVLTLTAREQHIRREKATSNICTNQGLMALAATIYMSLLGKSGLHDVAELCYHKAHHAAQRIDALDGYQVLNQRPFFNEFVVECPKNVSTINQHMLEHGLIGGLDLETVDPQFKNRMLVAVTELNSSEEIDLLLDLFEEARHE
ncbi:MAG: glycine dehydrogenase subunit 1 [Chloroflexota bacterium]|nr:glycine dehydrogenase subunit 1 [Chloroflexota bacterium]